MFRLALIAAFALSVAGAAAAQSAGSSPSEAKIAKARQLIEAMGGVKIYSVISSALSDQLTDGASELVKSMKLPSAPIQKAVLNAIIREDFTQIYVPKVTELAAQAYAEEFTDQELNDALAFYTSPSGRSFTEKMPGLTSRMLPMTKQIFPELFRDALLKYCRRTNCPKDEYDRLEEATDPMPRGRPR